MLFGEIVNDEMILNEFGLIDKNEWLKTPIIRRFTLNIVLDKFVIMLNHMYLIIEIKQCRGVLQYAPTNEFKSPSQNLGSIIRGFKSITTTQINQIRKSPKNPVWQRNYYERIIRNEYDLNRIRQYIVNNPTNWDLDRNNKPGLFM